MSFSFKVIARAIRTVSMVTPKYPIFNATATDIVLIYPTVTGFFIKCEKRLDSTKNKNH